ncbi:MAG: PaaI family thioesterase [Weeksellaceae bacterium]|jgi:uncharacterized protein (TIGR00369 family)|nr:PaaI family thioesterase [Weeksellaceae bacterium]MDX9705118.1 PaaI family thioesterase [Weeksellaceae bacterium]
MDKKTILEQLNKMNSNTLMEVLAIQFTDVSETFLEASMPVTPKVHQPYGILHGGASIALAETVGSVLSAMSIDSSKFKSVGLQMNANHLRPKKEGMLFAKAEFIKKGRTVHLVKIEIKDEKEKLICHCQLMNSIVSVDYV